MKEFKNLFKGSAAFLGIAIVLLVLLRLTAGEMNAGSEGFNLSMPFLLAQVLVIIISYTTWYRKVNTYAADMINLKEKRDMAFYYMTRHLISSVLITAFIAGIAVICMLLDFLFVGIPAIYCYSSVFSMLILGNLTLFILMRFVALPNSVTGLY